MKKIFLCFLLLVTLVMLFSCRKNTTEFYNEGDEWDCNLDGIGYSFKYVSRQEDGLYMKIYRNDVFYRGEIIDDDIYIYSKSDSFDYVNVNDENVSEEIINFVILIGVYKVGTNNVAEFYIHSSLKTFNGFVKAEPRLQPTTSYAMQIIQLELY